MRFNKRVQRLESKRRDIVTVFIDPDEMPTFWEIEQLKDQQKDGVGVYLISWADEASMKAASNIQKELDSKRN